MSKKLLRDAIILLLVFGGLWAIFSLFFPSEIKSKGWLNKEQETKLATFITDMIEAQYSVLDSSEWQPGLDSMLVVLLSHIEESRQETYTIQVLDDASINAFATLDGHIYFFRGLLELAEQPEEIAAVIAHEMGHIEKDHVIKKLISEFGITVLLGISTGGDAIIVKEVLKMLSSGAFSRKQEREADEFALALLFNAGINPKNLGVMFRKLQEKSSDIPEISILSSHPSTKARIKMSFEYKLDGFQEKAYQFPWPGIEYEEEALEGEDAKIDNN